MSTTKHPKGTRFNRWLLNKEKQRGVERFTIKRWAFFPDGTSKAERLPVKKYQEIRDNEDELKKLVIRMNAQVPEEQKTRTAVELKHAFIDTQMLDDYKDYLIVQIPTRSKAINEHNYLVNYFLNFFIGKLNLADPLQWHKIHKTEWAKFLVSDEAPAAAGSKKEIVAASNRFMAWLHQRRPQEVPPLKFEPLTRAKYKEIDAVRKMKGEAREPQLVKDEHWAIIRTKLPATIAPFVLLAYYFGLRRAEALGLNPGDARKGYLLLERQLAHFKDKEPVYLPLKGREGCRRIPYWHSGVTEAHAWIEAGANIKMHPDTLSDRWTELMDQLKLTYTLHDLRHTWITKSIRGRDQRDVQLAAGHRNIETTMGYLHDDREFDDEVFVPEKKVSKLA